MAFHLVTGGGGESGAEEGESAADNENRSLTYLPKHADVTMYQDRTRLSIPIPGRVELGKMNIGSTPYRELSLDSSI